jgi:hypothetical protein
MTENLQSRKAPDDLYKLREVVGRLRLDRRAVRLLPKLNEEILLHPIPAWSDTHLVVLGQQMFITDYPFTNHYSSTNEILGLFKKGVSLTSLFPDQMCHVASFGP